MCVLIFLLLLWPAFVNKSPFIYFDTGDYFRVGNPFDIKLAALGSRLGLPVADRSAAILGSGPGFLAGPMDYNYTNQQVQSFARGRFLFSFFTATLIHLGGLWAVVAVETLLTALALILAYRAVSRAPGLGRLLAFAALLSLFSLLPFHASLAMPDVFAGVALGLMAVFVLAFDTVRTWSRIAMAGLLSLAIAMHPSLVPLCGLEIAVLGGCVCVAARRVVWARWPVAVWAACPIVFAMLLTWAGNSALERMVHGRVTAPPIMMARVLVDGPGWDYLDQACHPVPKFTICRFEHYKFYDSNAFLWSPQPGVGVFMLTDQATRFALKDEEPAFVAATFAQYPAKEAGHLVKNTIKGLLAESLIPTLYPAQMMWAQYHWDFYRPQLSAGFKNSLAYRGIFPYTVFDIVSYIVDAAALVWAFVFLARRRSIRPLANMALDYGTLWKCGVATILIMIVANAALCANVSTVQDRYQTRIIWLLPGVMFLYLCVALRGIVKIEIDLERPRVRVELSP